MIFLLTAANTFFLFSHFSTQNNKREYSENLNLQLKRIDHSCLQLQLFITPYVFLPFFSFFSILPQKKKRSSCYLFFVCFPLSSILFIRSFLLSFDLFFFLFLSLTFAFFSCFFPFSYLVSHQLAFRQANLSSHSLCFFLSFTLCFPLATARPHVCSCSQSLSHFF